jgi:hypothetical protein
MGKVGLGRFPVQLFLFSFVFDACITVFTIDH